MQSTMMNLYVAVVHWCDPDEYIGNYRMFKCATDPQVLRRRLEEASSRREDLFEYFICTVPLTNPDQIRFIESVPIMRKWDPDPRITFRVKTCLVEDTTVITDVVEMVPDFSNGSRESPYAPDTIESCEFITE